MKNILVLGEIFPYNQKINVINILKIEDINLKVADKSLLVFVNNTGWQKVDGVIWRLLNQENFSKEYQLLNIINYSGVPCLNCASVYLSLSNRLSVLKLLEKNNIPLNSSQVHYGTLSKLNIELKKIPSVFKTGDFHCGYGKFIIRDSEVLSDVNDFSTLVNDYVTVEDYIPYQRDIRCLLIDAKAIFLEKKSNNWKANVNPYSIEVVPKISLIYELSLKIKNLLRADVVGIDWLQKQDDDWVAIETNLVPDLYCISEEVELANKFDILELILRNL
jgi:ribosomal protein S6--L-glutamate ligase